MCVAIALYLGGGVCMDVWCRSMAVDASIGVNKYLIVIQAKNIAYLMCGSPIEEFECYFGGCIYSLQRPIEYTLL